MSPVYYISMAGKIFWGAKVVGLLNLRFFSAIRFDVRLLRSYGLDQENEYAKTDQFVKRSHDSRLECEADSKETECTRLALL